MTETIATICEQFASEMDIDIAVYDGNGNAQYVMGTRELTSVDVSKIRNVLKSGSKLPFTLRLKDSNYFCMKTSDGILCAKGGFNCQPNYGSNFENKKSKRANEKPIRNFKNHASDIQSPNSDKRISSSDQDNKKPTDEHKLIQGFVNKGYIENELFDKEYSHGTKTVRTDIDIHTNDNIRQQERHNNNNNNNQVPNDKSAIKKAQPKRKIHKEPVQKTVLSKCLVKHDDVSDCLLAINIQTYIVVFRGFHDGRESWIKMIPRLNMAFKSLSHEE